MIDISIIIVSFNNLSFTKNCLESIIKYSSGVSYEIIIIDNNSTENIEEVTNQFDKIKLIKNESNKGFAFANNQGLKIAQGKYALILNNDTIFTENTLKTLFDYAEKRNEKAFYGCRLLNTDGSFQESVMNFPSVWNVFTDSFFLSKIFKNSKVFNKNAVSFSKQNDLVEVDVLKGAFIFGRLSDFLELDGFDERFYFYSEELDLCKRFKNNGGKVYYFPKTSIIHIGGATVKKDELFFYKNQAIARIQYFQKHFNGIEFLFGSLFYYLGIIFRIPLYFIIGILTLNTGLMRKSKHYFKQLCYYPRNVFK